MWAQVFACHNMHVKSLENFENPVLCFHRTYYFFFYFEKKKWILVMHTHVYMYMHDHVYQHLHIMVWKDTFQESFLSFNQDSWRDHTQILMLAHEHHCHWVLALPPWFWGRASFESFTLLTFQACQPANIWIFLLSALCLCLGYRYSLSHMAFPLFCRDPKLHLQACAAASFTHWTTPPLTYSLLMFNMPWPCDLSSMNSFFLDNTSSEWLLPSQFC